MLVRAAQGAARSVLLGAWGPSRGACEAALAGCASRSASTTTSLRVPSPPPTRSPDRRARPRAPWLRPARRPEPFEALAWAVCEQLIEYTRAAGIERRIVRRLGRGAPRPTCATCPAPSARRRGACPARVLRPLRRARARAAARGARGCERSGGPRRRGPRAWLAAPAGAPGDRLLDRRVPRAARAGPLRPGPRRRPRPAQARRAPAHAATRGTRERGGGARGLRALRALGRPRGRLRIRLPRATLPVPAGTRW